MVESCLVDGCVAASVLRGLCRHHYGMAKRAGTLDSFPRGRAAKSSGYKWLIEHASYSGDECLPWPFGRDRQGYGYARFDGKRSTASRVMCILAHGPPLFERADAAHSCGNGHLGCVNPNHLRWLSHADNIREADTAHGERAGLARLTGSDVVRIRADTRPQAVIGKEYGIHQSQVSRIKAGQRWRRSMQA